MSDKKITAVIIDDLELARASLKADLQDHCPHIDVIGEADGVLNGAKLLKSSSPDIIFLDINMNDGNGFDLLDIVDHALHKVIFVTGEEQHALKAFQYAAVDYLLKPVDPSLLINAVEKLNSNKEDNDQQLALLKESLGKTEKLEKIALHTNEKILVSRVDEIVRLESMTNYTYFYFADGTKLLVTRTLKEFDQMLSESGFERVHQSHLVNLEYVKAYIKSDGGYISMKDGSHVPVSIRKKPHVVSILNNL